MDAYKILRRMTFSRSLTKTVKKAVCARLQAMLDEEERGYLYWREHICHKLNKTRQRDLKRRFEKKIAAMKIVIYHLTPPMERETDEPKF